MSTLWDGLEQRLSWASVGPTPEGAPRSGPRRFVRSAVGEVLALPPEGHAWPLAPWELWALCCSSSVVVQPWGVHTTYDC